MSAEEKVDDSRFSFITVSSMIDNFDCKMKNTMVDYPTLLPEKRGEWNSADNSDGNLVTMSMSGLPDSEFKENKHEFMPLQINLDKNRKSVVPHLIVEDKGEKKDYLGTYKNYEILKINEKGEKSILCYRRYDNFDIFYNKLKRKFPHLVIPKLIGKNAFTKIITIDNEFYNKRRRQLNYFLNYLFGHHSLKDSRELSKFINDPEFDEGYFKKEDNLFYFPESCKNTESISNKIYGVFSNWSTYFKSNELTIRPSEEENAIKKMDLFYKHMLESFRDIKGFMNTYVENIRKSEENYAELANNFFYLKDVVFEAQNSKEMLFKYYDINQSMSKINKSWFLEGIIIEDKFEGFLSVLSGLSETFDRYLDYLKIYSLVYKAYSDSRVNRSSYDTNRIAQEWKSANEVKMSFEKGLLEEVKLFVEKYSKEYSDILEKYKLLVKTINSCEKSVFDAYSDTISKIK